MPIEEIKNSDDMKCFKFNQTLIEFIMLHLLFRKKNLIQIGAWDSLICYI